MSIARIQNQSTFAITTDAHFGFPRYRGDTSFTASSLLQSAIDDIKSRADVEFTVQLGDLINENKEAPIREQDELSAKFILEMYEQFAVPTYHILGNHDLITISEDRWKELLGYESLYYSFQTKEFHCLMLHTSCPRQHDYSISPEQIKWIKQELDAAQKPVLAFCHQQIAQHSLDETFWFKGCPEGAFVRNGDEVQRLFEASGKVVAVFNGHMHWNNLVVENGIPYFTVQSLIEDYKQDGTPSGCFAYVTISNNEVVVDVRGADSTVMTHRRG
jgi:3',5'-cyclic-AMP phosphodiesterase